MRQLFFEGEKSDEEIADLKDVFEALEVSRSFLHSVPVEVVLDFFDALATSWRNDAELLVRMPYVKALAGFIEKKNFSPLLALSMHGDYSILDQPLVQKGILLRAHPRGIVAHWLSGNAALLGMYSLAQAIATKNVSIVRPSSRAYSDIITLLETFSRINVPSLKGRDLAKCIAVVEIGRGDRVHQEEMSRKADIRIAWGGKEAIEAIGSLPKSVYCEDLLLGPKYSFAAVDRRSLSRGTELAKRLALDVASLNQFACSSPHVVFVEEGGDMTPDRFAEELGKALETVATKLIRKAPPDARKVMDILSVRAQYALKGKVIASKGTEWTVVLSRELELPEACGSWVVHIKPMKALVDIVPLISRRNQTLGIAIAPEDREALLSTLTTRGIDRVVPLGSMTFFSLPWDGMFMPERLVRFVSLGPVQ